MFNVKRDRYVPGLHNFKPPEELVPGFRVNADGTVRQGTLSASDFQGYPQPRYTTFVSPSQESLAPLVPMPPLLKAVPVEPSPAPPAQDWPEKGIVWPHPLEQLEQLYWLERGNRLGIPDNLMRDPDWRPPPEWYSDQIQMDPHGRAVPWPRPWPNPWLWPRPER